MDNFENIYINKGWGNCNNETLSGGGFLVSGETIEPGVCGSCFTPKENKWFQQN